jgi:hypothetical protein
MKQWFSGGMQQSKEMDLSVCMLSCGMHACNTTHNMISTILQMFNHAFAQTKTN